MTFKHLRNVRGFFSDYYLGSVFGQREAKGRQKTFSDREIGLAYSRFRRLYDRATGRAQDAHSVRERFIRPLLRDVLGYHLGRGEEGLHRLYASADEEQTGKKAVLIAYCGAWDEELDSGRGKANPSRKLEQTLSQLSFRYGLMLSGERARLVRAPGEGPRGAYLEADFEALAEDEDLFSFSAFLKLFSISNFLPDAQGKLPIEGNPSVSVTGTYPRPNRQGCWR